MQRQMKSGLIAQIELVVGLIILGVIVILVFMASLMRFFGHPLIWSVDLAQLLFIWLCFLGADRALRMKGHMGVDLIIRRLGNRKRLLVESALALCTLGFLSSLAVKGVQLTLLNKERLYGDSGIPYYFVTIAVPFGCLMLGITVIRNFIFAWRNKSSGCELIFSKDNVVKAEVN
jgi:TRAP-type C4-dicarboxylate transport system permease small subunit